MAVNTAHFVHAFCDLNYFLEHYRTRQAFSVHIGKLVCRYQNWKEWNPEEIVQLYGSFPRVFMFYKL